MTEEYDAITAGHYAAYRPPLHSAILAECISNKQFTSGLDVGCGTGRSTLALAAYCKSTTGIDPSAEMLEAAQSNPEITYLKGSLEDLGFSKSTFDIVTFAGVLFYAKSQKLFEEVIKVCKTGATILVYDFEVVLDVAYDALGIISVKDDREYDHSINFSGLSNKELQLVQKATKKSDLSISPSDLTHLTLSEKTVYEQVRIRWGTDELFQRVHDVLQSRTNGKSHPIEVNYFYSIYENIK